MVEDDADFADSLAAIFEGAEGFCLQAVCGSSEECLARLKQSVDWPHLVLVDLQLPGLGGCELISLLKLKNEQVRCVAHTVFEDRKTVFRALKMGADGYLLKGCTGEQLLGALRTLDNGGAPLTPKIARMLLADFQAETTNPLTARELEVLELLGQGFSYKQSAHRLHVSVHTVHGHVKSIYEKMAVGSKAEAVEKAKRRGWL